MIAEAVISLLYDDPELEKLVGRSIRPNVVPVAEDEQEEASVYVMDYQMEELNCDGPSKVHNGVIEIGVHSQDYNTCTKVIKEVRRILNDYSGFVGDVGITFLTGKTTADGFDEAQDTNVKVVEYEAYAQLRS